MTLNQMTVKANLKRIDICDLLIACNVVDEATDENNTKWAKLHDKLKAILDEFDANLKYSVKDAHGKEIAVFTRRREAEIFIEMMPNREYTLEAVCE